MNDDTQLVIEFPEGGYDTPHSPSNPPEGMTLVWSDEFDGASINSANWVHELGGGGWGNQELQVYTNDDAEVPVQWEESDARYITDNAEQVKLRSFSTSVHKVEGLVSYKASED